MRNILNGLVITSLIVFVGCASTEAIHKNYNSLVNLKDGVDSQEAKILAQRMIVSTDEQRSYRMTAPSIKTTQHALKYPEYWFVVFGHNWFSPISTDPMAQTYTQLRETYFLVVINKANGNIKFAGLWYPKRSENFDWVFDPDAYKATNALTLAPYQKVIIH
jgi:uncharacterized protein YcfL